MKEDKENTFIIEEHFKHTGSEEKLEAMEKLLIIIIKQQENI
jgi:hypothetical protein